MICLAEDFGLKCMKKIRLGNNQENHLQVYIGGTDCYILTDGHIQFLKKTDI